MGLFGKLFGGKGGAGGNEPGKGVEELARRLKMEAGALAAVPVAYRELKLTKRNGGVRVLHAPEEGLKTVQRTILRRVLGRLGAHPAAMGFERGQSIASNAAPHVGAAVVLKMDIRDFFTQTTATRVRAYFVKIGWSGSAADLLLKLTTHKGGLPQGAPTSPRLSNLVNYGLDARLFALGMKLGATYTRYADDMTFSFAEDHRGVVAQTIIGTQQIVAANGYHLHTKKKLKIKRRHDRMLVTGLVVNRALNLPRETRRRLRAVEHHLKVGKTATMTAQQLHGWKSLAAMVAARRNGDARS